MAGKHKIQFEVNGPKAVEAVLYLLKKRNRKDGENIYNVLKALFEADKFHLNKHARPVTGDTYIRMPYGTVPSTVKNIIDGDFITLGFLNIGAAPFKKFEKKHHLKANREPDMDYLSESDVEALDAGADKYLGLSFGEVHDLNHQEPCWLNSEPNQAIDFALMIEDEEIRKLLLESPLKIVV